MQQLPQTHDDVHGAGYNIIPNVSDALPQKYTIRFDNGTVDYYNKALRFNVLILSREFVFGDDVTLDIPSRSTRRRRMCTAVYITIVLQ